MMNMASLSVSIQRGLVASLKKEIERCALASLTGPNDGAYVTIPGHETLWSLISNHRGETVNLDVEVAVSEFNGGVPNCVLRIPVSVNLAELESKQKVLLGNAFSLQMLEDKYSSIKVRPVEYPVYEKGLAQAYSVIGHPDTARVVSGLLGREVEFNRESVTLAVGDVLYVAQVIGGRLPEGATELPEGVEIVFREVVVDYE